MKSCKRHLGSMTIESTKSQSMTIESKGLELGVLNFTQNCVSNTKVSRGAKIVPNLGSRCKYRIFTWEK